MPKAYTRANSTRGKRCAASRENNENRPRSRSPARPIGQQHVTDEGDNAAHARNQLNAAPTIAGRESPTSDLPSQSPQYHVSNQPLPGCHNVAKVKAINDGRSSSQFNPVYVGGCPPNCMTHNPQHGFSNSQFCLGHLCGSPGSSFNPVYPCQQLAQPQVSMPYGPSNHSWSPNTPNIGYPTNFNPFLTKPGGMQPNRMKTGLGPTFMEGENGAGPIDEAVTDVTIYKKSNPTQGTSNPNNRPPELDLFSDDAIKMEMSKRKRRNLERKEHRDYLALEERKIQLDENYCKLLEAHKKLIERSKQLENNYKQLVQHKKKMEDNKNILLEENTTLHVNNNEFEKEIVVLSKKNKRKGAYIERLNEKNRVLTENMKQVTIKFTQLESSYKRNGDKNSLSDEKIRQLGQERGQLILEKTVLQNTYKHLEEQHGDLQGHFMKVEEERTYVEEELLTSRKASRKRLMVVLLCAVISLSQNVYHLLYARK